MQSLATGSPPVASIQGYYQPWSAISTLASGTKLIADGKMPIDPTYSTTDCKTPTVGRSAAHHRVQCLDLRAGRLQLFSHVHGDGRQRRGRQREDHGVPDLRRGGVQQRVGARARAQSLEVTQAGADLARGVDPRVVGGDRVRLAGDLSSGTGSQRSPRTATMTLDTPSASI